MCGIAGMIGEGNFGGNLKGYAKVFDNMQATLRRRGPDQEGIYLTDSAALIHTRLSVVDLENGKQPMIYESNRDKYILIYNGELYNTKEIRADLTALGHRFIGHSDTEVLLHAYAEWSDECIRHLNGIFAFAVWEENAKRLFVARDRLGVKPFFYCNRKDTFIFASEIKALLEHPDVKPEIDSTAIAEIMLVGPGRTPGYGVFKSIEELKPAHCGYYEKGELKLRKYWALRDKPHTDSLSQTIEQVRFLVTDSIERQLVSDVPIGTFLSGGLDSSIISSIASRYHAEHGKELHTFSVDYKDNDKFFKSSKFQPDSDMTYIEIMNKYLGATHHRILLDTDELAAALYSAVEARDLPGMADVDSSLLLFCGKVKEHVTVALSGECADEIFGGYPWYRDKAIREKDGFPWAQSTDYRSEFLKPEFAEQINFHQYIQNKYQRTINETDILPTANSTERRMREMMNLNLEWFMQTLLDRKDRMSMHNSLEVRVPFCDYRIVDYLYSVPWEMKDFEGREKGLLRTAMQGLLPDEVLWRKKSPYPKTHNPSYLNAVSKILQEIIHDSASPIFQFVKKSALENLLKSDNSVPWYGQLMATPQTIAYFIQINHWLDKYHIKIV